MLRIDLTQAEPGMKLALPVQNPKAVMRNLLKVGYPLTEEAIQRVGEMGVRSVWVAYPSLSEVEKYMTLEGLKVQQDVVAKIADAFGAAQGQTAAKLDYHTYRSSVTGMIQHVATNPKTSVFIGELSDSDDYLMRHASAVTYLSVLMGMKLEAYLVKERKHVNPIKAKEIINLGVGAMLHDYGLTLLDDEVRQRYEHDADESDPAYREHPALGFRAVRGQVDPSAATCVLHHHQRYDGSGFAGAEFPAKAGGSIHVYARIVAVADQFNRLRRSVNLPEQPTVAVLGAMLSPAMRPWFDPQVLAALVEVVPPYAPGSVLRLSDGRSAVCIDHNPADPCRPVVQVISELGAAARADEESCEDETIDLSQEPPALFVAECDGHPVAEFNFTPEALRQQAA